MKITATVEPKGAKFLYRVFVDGELRKGYPMTSKVGDYRFVLVQRWRPIGDESEYGAPDQWAARFSRKPKPLGAKIEYGYCAEVVAIVEAES
jgi:hypothetical protein